MRSATLFFFSLVSLSPLLAGAEQIYHWVDDQGVTHFEERPRDASAQPIDIRVQRPSQTAEPESLDALHEAASEAEQARADEKAQKLREKEDAARSAILAENCQKARDNARIMSEHGRIRGLDKTTGELVYLTPSEKAAREKATQEYLDKHCSPATTSN